MVCTRYDTVYQTMDEEARVLADDLFQRTIALMEEHKEDVRRVAELLLEQETISHSDVARLIGDRKFSAGPEYDEFVSMKKKIDSSSTAQEDTEGAEAPPTVASAKSCDEMQ